MRLSMKLSRADGFMDSLMQEDAGGNDAGGSYAARAQ